jgi:ABC-type branched-subunit amino acid transport system ATPase component
MPKSDIIISLPVSEGQEKRILNGSHPVVFIGPNGAGKTRFGKNISDLSKGTRIPALRSLAFDETIWPRDLESAKREASDKFAETKSVWSQVDVLNQMLAELKAEDNEANSRLKNETRAKKAYVEPEISNLDRLCAIWEEIFPNRKLDFSGHKPRVTATHRGVSPSTYNANTMSDGERAAIYLIASILRAPAGLLIIDEPEVHFHGLLARTFWDRIEEARNDCRFVYITHDIPFALSRRAVEIGIVENDTSARMVPAETGIPPEIIQNILGAASLSLVANTIVFTEGNPGSLDPRIFNSWFKTPGVVSIPVGNCNAVRQAISAFTNNPGIIIKNAKFLGIVERDYFPDSYLGKLKNNSNLHLLPVHEIEGLLCLRGVASAVMKHKKIPQANFDASYNEFEAEVRSRFTGIQLNKQILERVKCDIDISLRGLMNNVDATESLENLRESSILKFSTAFKSIDMNLNFQENEKILLAALAAGASEFLKFLPGKDCLAILLRKLGLTQEEYTDLITRSLAQVDGKESAEFINLKNDLISSLKPLLPPR